MSHTLEHKLSSYAPLFRLLAVRALVSLSKRCRSHFNAAAAGGADVVVVVCCYPYFARANSSLDSSTAYFLHHEARVGGG